MGILESAVWYGDTRKRSLVWDTRKRSLVWDTRKRSWYGILESAVWYGILESVVWYGDTKKRSLVCSFNKFCEGCGSPVIKVSDHDRHVMSSSPVPLNTHRVGQRCTLNLSRAKTSSRWCDGS
ncbi:hypothetical protein TNCV_2505521 [Trichonephila clavipes]|uniref:Uncharacterized protein n=1 Tax=Trichonephila clavipes TaxID=2585209 RepID=A0A8X7BL38_TRICX|nr:hypothetical protein TNCV_2505521 [Trichonephila clavipes]